MILNKVVMKFYGADYPIRKLNNPELQRFIEAQQLSKTVKNVTIKKRTRLILDVINLARINHGFTPHSYNVDLKDDAADMGVSVLTTKLSAGRRIIR